MFGFHKVKEINPYPVADRVRFRNLDKTLTLEVRGEAATMILKLKAAQDRLSRLSDESEDTERLEAAHEFAAAMFNTEQADKLCGFYDYEPLAIVAACGAYFTERLAGLITKAQKREK